MVSLGAKLKLLRKEKGLTLEELAVALNRQNPGARYSKGKLSLWERDKQEPVLGAIKEVANFYGVSVDYFLDDQEALDSLMPHDKQRLLRVPVIGKITNHSQIDSAQNLEGYYLEYFPSGAPTRKIFDFWFEDSNMFPSIPQKALVCLEDIWVIDDGDIVAVLFEDSDHLQLFSLRSVGKYILLISDDRSAKPIILGVDKKGKLIGRVLHYTFFQKE